MTIQSIFDSASSIMTAVSFTAFLGILWWVFVHKRSADFDEVARLPFADEEDAIAGAGKPAAHTTEARHG
jgi:cytochrome c oxidase cbb3-type subunit 4